MIKRKFSKEFKLSILREHDEDGTSFYKLSKKYGIEASCLRRWSYNLNVFGEGALEKHNSDLCNYSAEFKQQVVSEYLAGGISFKGLALKHGILAPSTVGTWVKQYNSHIELTTSRPEGRMTDMANEIPGRKTSFDERVQIVSDCIANNHNYAETALKHSVSYNQLYAWVKKYESGGVKSLQDRRGKNKSPDEMSEIDKLKAENKLLRAKAKEQQMEIDFLKKVEEIERR